MSSDDVTGAFLTGSHAYGEPHATSDVDMVIYMDECHACDLLDAMGVEDDGSYSGAAHGYQFKAGKLNVIICTNLKDFRAWEKGTYKLRELKPVTRKHAIEILDECGVRGPKRNAS